jgi:hypothetical protein
MLGPGGVRDHDRGSTLLQLDTYMAYYMALDIRSTQSGCGCILVLTILVSMPVEHQPAYCFAL